MPTTPLNYSIETENLNLWYGDFQALIEVNVKIPDGQITSLIGPSGCGKSTLLRCFNRVNERYGNVTTKGKIEVLGKNIYDPDVSLPELRKAVGMVFQRPNPLPISIYENILFGLRIHSPVGHLTRTESDQIVEEALDLRFPMGRSQGQIEGARNIAPTRAATKTLYRTPVTA